MSVLHAPPRLAAAALVLGVVSFAPVQAAHADDDDRRPHAYGSYDSRWRENSWRYVGDRYRAHELHEQQEYLERQRFEHLRHERMEHEMRERALRAAAWHHQPAYAYPMSGPVIYAAPAPVIHRPLPPQPEGLSVYFDLN